VWPYGQIARVDHWFKNIFMLLGILLAFLYKSFLFTWASVPQLGFASLATCLIASSNYVLNKLIDAPSDRFHPVKSTDP
jgi:decaprenyl-phosphate phosphoribosyltransferase